MANIPAVFSDWAVSNMHTVDWGTETVHLFIMERAPVFPDLYVDDYMGSSSAHWSVHDTIDDLLDSPGWQSVDETFSHQNNGTSSATSLGVSITGGITQVGAGFSFTYESDAPVFAKAFVLTDDAGHIICSFAPASPIYIAGTPDNPTYLIPNASAGSNFLFSYKTEVDGGVSVNHPVIGPVALAIPSLKWEGARAAHVWLVPQRINFVANPSFEVVGDDATLFGWRSNSIMSRVTGGIKRPPREKCALLSGNEPIKILESTLFPATFSTEYWSIEAAVAGNGRVRIGVLFYQEDMDPEECFYFSGPWENVTTLYESGDITQDNFRVIRAVIDSPETVGEALFRLEFEGDDDESPVWVDNVLVDPNEAQMGYFDGGWDMGQLGDYSWYNGIDGQDVNAPHKTFSVFYNNKKTLASYLFDTSSGNVPRHAALSWVPEGSSVVPHWNDLYGIRTHSWRDDIVIPTKDYADKGVVTTL